MSPSCTVHGGQYDTKYVTFELLLNAAFVADEIWVFTLEPARIYTKYVYTRYSIPVWIKKIGAASTAVPSLSNIMHIVLNIKANLRPVRANIICRRPSSLLTQHLQAYRGAIKEIMLRYSPSICCQYYYPGMITPSISLKIIK